MYFLAQSHEDFENTLFVTEQYWAYAVTTLGYLHFANIAKSKFRDNVYENQ